MSADLISKQGSCLSDKQQGGTSSGYESMLRESEGSGSSTINEDSADESSGDRKKGNKKKKLPSKLLTSLFLIKVILETKLIHHQTHILFVLPVKCTYSWGPD